MGHYYNDALIACENHYGYSLIRIYTSGMVQYIGGLRPRKGSEQNELGWNTNKMTRPQMLAQLAEEILDGSTDMR